MTVQYRDSGVDLERAGDVAVRMRERLGTRLFGGFVPAGRLKQYDDPMLVSSIDGVGTKIHLAMSLGRVEGLGQDIVHHCVNDIAVHGAIPVFFLDYLAFHRLDPPLVEQLVSSIAGACDALGIALTGGETAEMPLVYPPGRGDMAGAIVGVVERAQIIDGSAIREGDVLLGLPSSGPHTNGYSLVQHLCAEDEYSRYEPELGTTLGEALLVPHRCYLDDIQALIATGTVHGLAHITGGGIDGNLSRIMPSNLQAVIDLRSYTSPPIFRYLAARGVPDEEMRAVFNLGIGLIAVCDSSVVPQAPQHPLIGVVEESSTERSVVFHGYD